MHEYNVCQNIVDQILAAVGAVNRRVVRARVAMGGLRGVEEEALNRAYRTLTEGTIASNSILELDILPVSALCHQCGWKGEIRGTAFLCPACKGTRGLLSGGREMYIECLEVEER
jgi:hydrogenase nickel incorporation protein HypA/HybF